MAPWQVKWSDADRLEIIQSKKAINKIGYQLQGGDPLGKYEFPTEKSIQEELFNVYFNMKESLQAPTAKHMNSISELSSELEKIGLELTQYENLLNALEAKLN